MSRAFAERIRVRGSSFGLTIAQSELDVLSRYVALLDRWNKTVNLTALPLDNLPDASVDRLILEPLAASVRVADEPLDWIDVGSGSGSPAIPLKIMRPQARLTMVESRTRKSAFLREAVRTLALSHASVEETRIESYGRLSSFDLVTIRGVRTDESLISGVRSLLRPGGDLLLFGSEPKSEELQGFERVGTIPLPGERSQLIFFRRT